MFLYVTFDDDVSFVFPLFFLFINDYLYFFFFCVCVYVCIALLVILETHVRFFSIKFRWSFRVKSFLYDVHWLMEQ